ncbi:hypothetical protein ABTZ93_05040 [Streptomyces sp. NPDC097941]
MTQLDRNEPGKTRRRVKGFKARKRALAASEALGGAPHHPGPVRPPAAP